MEFDHFEEQLNKKFKTFQPQLDETGLWETIETQLAPEKKEKKVGWLWLLALASALVAITVFWSLTDSGSINAVQESRVDDVVEAHQEIDEYPAASATPDRNSQSEQRSSGSAVIEPIAQKNSETIAGETVNFNSEITEQRTTVTIDETVLTNSLSNVENSKSKNMYSENTRDFIHSVPQVSTNEVIARTKSPVASLSIIQVDPISSLSYLLSYQRDAFSMDKEWSRFTEKVSFSEVANSSRFSFMVGLGYSKIAADLQLVDNSFQDLLDVRKSSAFQLEALSAELRLNYALSDSWILISGVHYNMINTGSETTHSTSTVDLVTDTIAIVQSFTGVRYEEGPVQELTTKTSMMRRYNQFHNVTVPLGLSYNMEFAHHYTWNVGLIYELGLYNSNSGYEQDEGSLEYNISTDNESRFKEGGLNNFLVETQLHRHFGKRSSVFLGLQYRRGLSNIYNNNYSIKKRFDLFGLSTGISVSL